MRKLLVLAIAALALLPLSVAVGANSGADWLDPDWSYRRPVTISNPCGEEATDYQVQVTLDSTFDFSKALGDGSDLRVTDGNGVTLIPFWIEEWDPGNEAASIWVKVPSIPTTGTTIYLYYGNPDPPPFTEPDPVETPPIGPWTRAAGNPIRPIGDPGNGARLLAENVVYDTVTDHYWLLFANYRSESLGLAWSDDPGNPAAWHWHDGNVVSSANAPHILEHNGTWYIFYADRAHRASNLPGYSGAYPNSYPVSVATSSSVSGPYTYAGIVLTSTEPWEAYRVDEPYVFQRNDGKWILMYMGDSGGAHEQVSYAEADNILGPYTKFPGGLPAIPFGPPGSYDAGTVADAWVVEFHGVYYIGYTVSPTTSSPWQTAYATTTDWQTFTKHGITLPLGPAGEWDSNNSFRGAVTRFDDIYYFPYTGDSYMMGMATQPVWQTPPLPVGPEAVFPFFDDFNDDTFDTAKWLIDNGAASQVAESGGLLTLTATGTYIKIVGQTSVGMDYLVEARARHPNAGTPNQISEVGLCGSGGFANTVRMADDFHNTVYWERQAKTATTPGDPWTTMAVPGYEADTNWHIFRTYRLSPNLAGFQIDDTPAETDTLAVPTVNLPAFLMSYGSGNRFVVDWIRVRKWCGAESLVTVGDEEAFVTEVQIDIKPGSDPNSINLKSKGVVPVAVLTTDDFDASTVDPNTVVFAGAEPLRWTLEDVDGDGDVDILFHFKTQELDLTSDSIEATLTGSTYGGQAIQGTDTVNIVPTGKSK